MLSFLKAFIFITILSYGVADGDFNLSIIHVNDIHVRFEETDTYSGTCKKEENPDQGLIFHIKNILTVQISAK